MPEIDSSFFSYNQVAAHRAGPFIPKTRGIPLNPNAILKLANSTEEYAYQKGFLTLFKLRPNPTTVGCYHFDRHPLSRPLDPSAASIQTPNDIYPFVILDTDQGFDLRIGTGGHYRIANKADYVRAAGELHCIPNGEAGAFITMIIPKSGSYYLDSLDIEYQEALKAMDAVGLPMKNFRPFQEESASKTLFFSTGPAQRQAPTEKTSYCSFTETRSTLAQAEDPSRPCTGARPRVLLPVP